MNLEPKEAWSETCGAWVASLKTQGSGDSGWWPVGRTTKCDGLQRPMQRNATLCNGLQHPHAEGTTQLNDLQDFHATLCNGMQRFATVSAKTGLAPNQASSRHPQHYVFALWKNGSRTTKCDGMLQSTLQNVTECYGMLHPDGGNPAICTDKQRLTRTDATKCYGMLRNATVCEKTGLERDL